MPKLKFLGFPESHPCPNSYDGRGGVWRKGDERIVSDVDAKALSDFNAPGNYPGVKDSVVVFEVVDAKAQPTAK